MTRSDLNRFFLPTVLPAIFARPRALSLRVCASRMCVLRACAPCVLNVCYAAFRVCLYVARVVCDARSCAAAVCVCASPGVCPARAGFRALYKGMGAPLVSATIVNAITFGAYAQSQRVSDPRLRKFASDVCRLSVSGISCGQLHQVSVSCTNFLSVSCCQLHQLRLVASVSVSFISYR